MSSKTKAATKTAAAPAHHVAASASAAAQFNNTIKALEKTQKQQLKIAEYQAHQSSKSTRAVQETAMTNRFLWHSKHRTNIIVAIIAGVVTALVVQMMINLYMDYKYMIEGINSSKGLQPNFPNGWVWALAMEFPFVAKSFVGDESVVYAVYQCF